MARRRKKGAALTTEDLREELREDNRRILDKLDTIQRAQNSLEVKVAETAISAKAAHSRVGRVEAGIKWFTYGILGAAGYYLYETITGKKV